MHKTSRSLQTIPGIGPRLAEELVFLGYTSPDELRSEDPEKMYDRLCRLRGHKIDRCVLYTFRCAVYFVNHTRHDPKLLQWWNWKNREL